MFNFVFNELFSYRNGNLLYNKLSYFNNSDNEFCWREKRISCNDILNELREKTRKNFLKSNLKFLQSKHACRMSRLTWRIYMGPLWTLNLAVVPMWHPIFSKSASIAVLLWCASVMKIPHFSFIFLPQGECNSVTVALQWRHSGAAVAPQK